MRSIIIIIIRWRADRKLHHFRALSSTITAPSAIGQQHRTKLLHYCNQQRHSAIWTNGSVFSDRSLFLRPYYYNYCSIVAPSASTLLVKSFSSTTRIRAQEARGDEIHESTNNEKKFNVMPWQSHHNNKVQKGFWKDQANHLRFFDWAAKQLGVSVLDDWYAIPRDKIYKLGGRPLLDAYYSGSVRRALTTIYPHHDWLPWRFPGGVPTSYWTESANCRKFFDWAAIQLGINQHEQWYERTNEDIHNLGGRAMLASHSGSLTTALAFAYPEIEWRMWKIPSGVPVGFWNDFRNQRKFFDWIAKQLRMDPNSPSDWYSLRREDVYRLGGTRLLHDHYAGSLIRALTTLYPELELLPWKFTSCGLPRRFWSDPANHRKFFEWAAKELGVSEPRGWYNVSRQQIYELGGKGLLDDYYSGSLRKALSAVYDSVEWEPWRFRHFVVNNNNNKNKNNNDEGGGGGGTFSEADLRRYIESLARELGIGIDIGSSGGPVTNNNSSSSNSNNNTTINVEDWYRVSVGQIREFGGYNIIAHFGGLYAVLSKLYPQYAWEQHRFNTAVQQGKKKTNQLRLRVAVQRLFPNQDIIEGYKHPSVFFATSGESITLDLWVPSLSLAFEYHGEQHYHDRHVLGGGSSAQQSSRDADKATACKNAGITLITVPYWWDHTLESLASDIRRARPDIEIIIPTTTTTTTTAR